jgi:hypothetical protein
VVEKDAEVLAMTRSAVFARGLCRTARLFGALMDSFGLIY